MKYKIIQTESEDEETLSISLEYITDGIAVVIDGNYIFGFLPNGKVVKYGDIDSVGNSLKTDGGGYVMITKSDGLPE